MQQKQPLSQPQPAQSQLDLRQQSAVQQERLHEQQQSQLPNVLRAAQPQVVLQQMPPAATTFAPVAAAGAPLPSMEQMSQEQLQDQSHDDNSDDKDTEASSDADISDDDDASE